MASFSARRAARDNSTMASFSAQKAARDKSAMASSSACRATRDAAQQVQQTQHTSSGEWGWELASATPGLSNDVSVAKAKPQKSCSSHVASARPTNGPRLRSMFLWETKYIAGTSLAT